MHYCDIISTAGHHIAFIPSKFDHGVRRCPSLLPTVQILCCGCIARSNEIREQSSSLLCSTQLCSRPYQQKNQRNWRIDLYSFLEWLGNCHFFFDTTSQWSGSIDCHTSWCYQRHCWGRLSIRYTPPYVIYHVSPSCFVQPRLPNSLCLLSTLANITPFLLPIFGSSILGIRHFFLQPGTYDKETDAWLRRWRLHPLPVKSHRAQSKSQSNIFIAYIIA